MVNPEMCKNVQACYKLHVLYIMQRLYLLVNETLKKQQLYVSPRFFPLKKTSFVERIVISFAHTGSWQVLQCVGPSPTLSCLA